MHDATVVPLPDGSHATIRPASVSDARQIIELDAALAADGRGMVLAPDQIRTLDQERRRIDDVYRAMSAGDATLSIVAELGDPARIVGSADLRQLEPARCHHVGVLSVGVHVDFQRRGLGRALMRRLIDHARSCGLFRLELYVRADNVEAHALYRSLGFRHEATRARFVRLLDGTFIDDLIFVLFL